ncbi:hypothetical protein O9X98_04795 [Agrobacterium salinitolerans]|nr:hypothetical protein [Agrobacterium salinitolerans]
MARRPVRVRNRGEGNELAPLDGFAAAPPARRHDQQQQHQQVVDPNSMQAHFGAILNSDLVDEIDDETAFARAQEHRVTDNFGAAFSQYRRQVEGVGQVYDPRGIHDGRPAPQGLLPRQHGAGQQANNHRANVPAHAPRNALVGHDPNVRMHAPAGMTGFVQLRRLDPFMLTQIRKLGRDIFAQYAGNMALEDINMMGAIRGQPQFHSEAEVHDTIRFVTNNGHEVTSDNLDFGQNIPGYRAQTSLWEVDHFNFLIVKDNHGEYVYGWPRAPRPAIAQAPNVPRLR